MLSISGSFGIAALLGAALLVPSAPLAAQQPPPNGGAPRGAPQQGGRPPQQQGTPGQPLPFQPGHSTWSRFSARDVPTDVKEPTGPELAAQLGLEVLGPQGPDQIVQYRHKQTGMLFVFVPGGPFPMGSNHGEINANPQLMNSAARGKADETYFGSEQPQQMIYVSSYFIGVYEITNAEYRPFVEACRAGNVGHELEYPFAPRDIDHTPYLWDQKKYPFWGDRQPVVGITWVDAWAFARWMGGRLPTEAEWEKAARGTDRRLWPWGNRFDGCARTRRRARTDHARRRDLPGGRSVFGCYDMAGNAAEYVLDAHDLNTYRFMPKKDPCLLERDPVNDRRVIRGGRWNHFGLLHTARCTRARDDAGQGALPVGEDDKNEYPVTEYLSSGARVVLSPMVDLYPEGAIEQLRAKYLAAAEERRKAIERKRGGDAKGKAPEGDVEPQGDDGGSRPTTGAAAAAERPGRRRAQPGRFRRSWPSLSRFVRR
jgi:formylglycine-generating enzyme required for sulfatase activity